MNKSNGATSTFYIMIISLIVALGGFLMGFDASVISGVVKFIEPEFNLSKIELGWAVSCLTLTATLAMMVSGPLSDRIGRKNVLTIAAILYAISAILSALAPSFWFLVVARMIGGLGVGASLIIAPMYIAEISPPNLRGRMVSFNQLNIVVGISVAFFTNYLILQFSQSDAAWTKSMMFDVHQWRWMLGLETLPAIIYFFALWIVPKSPRWLAMKGKYDEALAIMKTAVGETEAEKEIAEIKESMAAEGQTEKVPIRKLLEPSLRFVLIIGLVIGILQQITGINSVFFYAPIIFEQSGIGTDASFVQAIMVGLINLVFTIVAIVLIDRIGRKPLLIVGVSGIVLSMFLLSYGFGAATYTITDTTISSLPQEIDRVKAETLKDVIFDSDISFKSALVENFGEEIAMQHESAFINNSIKMNPMLVLIGVLAFVASFAVSLGPVMWVLFSELFPNWIRGLAISFVGLANSAVSFLVQLVFPWELANFGNSATFMIYGIFAVIGLIFIVLKLPETKGKSLEELEKLLVK